ncbi:FecR family protein [Mangrovibacterium diazotrophicum]|uniref:FecR family protein n=1 Tax=Mangrovibacterium diazotrophicum TaxID=1261403 RepID=A0A419W785_9BACT|nr:FecR family protein [Mangrovibacterium diazotrophicum]RKD91337.1 FecR family protein [Mangrovibacterium diazotrophicum]
MRKDENIAKRFYELLDRFNSNDCSLEELYELQSYLDGRASSEMLRDRMMAELEEDEFPSIENFDGDQLFAKLNLQILKQKSQRSEEKKIRKIQFNWIQVAASVVLAFVFGGVVTYFLSKEEKGHLELASYCEVSAPLGSISQLTLPDSSVVWLNAGSKLKYSTRFNVDNRDLSLEGEGYFKVAKNKKLPFVVDAYGFQVRAVGTEFNVKAYPDEETIETILVEGKVKLEHRDVNIADDTYLNPKFMSTFYKSRDVARENGQPRLTISPNNDPLLYTSWKDDRLVFKKVTFKDLVKILERKYDVQIKLEQSEILNYHFTGVLEDESIDQVMEVIRISSPISYSIKGKTVFISKK